MLNDAGVQEGAYNDTWSSSNGAAWTQSGVSVSDPAFTNRYDHASVEFGGKMWVIGGSSGGNEVWASDNGTTWTTISLSFPTRQGHTCLVFNNKIWAIGGVNGSTYYNDVWSSPDGITWTQETPAAGFSARAHHSSAVFGGKMWVIGGSSGGNEVWSSPNGVTWTKEATAGFASRYCHSSVVFAGKLWVIGGYNGSTYYNDVWSSPNGMAWTQETAAAAFSARRGHTSIISDGKMWVIGGFIFYNYGWSAAYIYCNDVWSSLDGITWARESAAADFSPRSAHTSLTFNGNMWVIGGTGGVNNGIVWLSGKGPAAQAAPGALNFGSRLVASGPSAPSTVTLSNLYPQGWESLTIKRVSIQNDASGAFAFAGTPDTRPILLGEGRDFTVAFNPAAIGAATADLVFQTNDLTSPTIIVPLSGVGVDTPPAAPTNQGAAEVSADSIRWRWADNSNNEDGFKVWADPGNAAPITLQTTTAAGATSWTMSGLSPNSLYSFQVAATNPYGDSAKTDLYTTYTMIEPVSDLAFSGIGIDTISVAAANTPSNLDTGSSGIDFVNTTMNASSGWQHNNTAWASNGLSPNTQYLFSARSRNFCGIETALVTGSAWTRAAVPLAPLVGNPGAHSLDVSIASGDSNPAGTQYALYCETASQWVQPDGTLGASAAWATAASWGTKTVTGLNGATAYLIPRAGRATAKLAKQPMAPVAWAARNAR